MKMRMLTASMIMFCLLTACSDALEFSAFEGDGDFCDPVCRDGKICSAGQCIDAPASCRDGDLRCDGKQPQICSAFKWNNYGSSCSDSQNCLNGKCTIEGVYCGNYSVVTCVNDDNFIGNIYQCTNTKWARADKCPLGYSCTDYGNSLKVEDVCGICVEGDSKCEKTGDKSSFSVCQKGNWQTQSCSGTCSDKSGCE